MLPPASNEQIEIMEKLMNYNLVIDSVAGSGKTTTNLHIANKYINSKLLLLTYNSKLKLETREKVIKYNLKNIEVHSYHSFCVKYYDNKCYTDMKISDLLSSDLPTLKEFDYDIIIVDEVQDMNSIYFNLVCKIYRDNIVDDSRIIIFGDRNQSIYEFNNADERYIVFANKIFPGRDVNGKKGEFDVDLYWKELKLSQSFRITNEIANFLNHCMLGNDRIFASKINNIKPKYIICDTYREISNNESVASKEIRKILSLGYKYGDIFVLAPSVRTNSSPVRILANQLSMQGIPIYVPTSDTEVVDESVTDGKIIFCTLHQSKGRERPVTFIFGFDNSYFQFFKKNSNPYECPNELYVGVTRASERLYLFHHFDKDYLPFIKKSQLRKYCDLDIHTPLVIKELEESKFKSKGFIVTELIRHVPLTAVQKCMKLIKTEIIRKPVKAINIPIKSKQSVGYESVSEITGTAIPAYFEHLRGKKMSIFETILKVYDKSLQIKSIPIDTEQLEPSKLLYIANRWLTYTNGYIFKMSQIINYDWLSKENLDKCIERIKSLNLSSQVIFEQGYSSTEDKNLSGGSLEGYVDCFDISNNSVYEFKCVKTLSEEHIIQVAIYMYLFYKKYTSSRITSYFSVSTPIDYKNTKFYLYNILTDELISVTSTIDQLNDLVSFIHNVKVSKKMKVTDKEFIDTAIKLKENWNL